MVLVDEVEAISHASGQFEWAGIDKNVEALAKSCPHCLEVKSAPPGESPPMGWPSWPWSKVHVDFVGPIFGKIYFVFMDGHHTWL